MTIDETGKCIDLPIVHLEQDRMTETSPSLLENPDMLRSTFALVANSIVEASDLAREVKALREAVDNMNHALSVAHEREAHAHAERNEALQARDAAVRAREVADAAYDKVNAQRIAAEMEAHDLREDRDALTNSEAYARQELGEALSKIAELEAEVMRLKASHEAEISHANHRINEYLDKAKDFEDLYAMAEDDKKKLTAERDEACWSATDWERNYIAANEKAISALNRLADIRAIVG
jgi:chromosome segregation ATPase